MKSNLEDMRWGDCSFAVLPLNFGFREDETYHAPH